jgi:hypothetical protein
MPELIANDPRNATAVVVAVQETYAHGVQPGTHSSAVVTGRGYRPPSARRRTGLHAVDHTSVIGVTDEAAPAYGRPYISSIVRSSR